MDIKQLREQIHPTQVNLGARENGSETPYYINNNSGLDFLSFTKSCGCIGEIALYKRYVQGKFPAEYKTKTHDLYIADGHYCTKLNSANGDRYFDVRTEGFVDNPKTIEGPYDAHFFIQNITVKMDDGLSDYIITPAGEEIMNASKLRMVIPIKAYILAPDNRSNS